MRTPMSAIAAVLLFACSGSERALADEAYRMWGSDRFQTAAGGRPSEIDYSGRQSLSIRSERNLRIYHARAEYDRVEGGARVHAIATFGAEATAEGDVRDLESNDPDFMTVLNQPFNVELDRLTMRDLATLSAPIPFRFPSPVDGTALDGTLRHEATDRGERGILGVVFHVAGPMHGRVGDRSPETLDGRITVDGTARYVKASGLLRDLDATVTISGRVMPHEEAGVLAVYRRSIRRETQALAPVPAVSSRGTAATDRRKRATLPPQSRSLRS